MLKKYLLLFVAVFKQRKKTKMIKSKSGKVIAIVMLFLNLFVSVPAIAETYTPKDPESIYDDLRGN